MIYKYEIGMLPPSNNIYKGRSNVWEYRHDKIFWEVLVDFKCKDKPPEPIKCSIVTLTHYFKTKTRRDPSNYDGVFILDGLVKAGIIEDDSFKCIRLVLEGVVGSGESKTEITIEEVQNV